jgi:hypothetical protein
MAAFMSSLTRVMLACAVIALMLVLIVVIFSLLSWLVTFAGACWLYAAQRLTRATAAAENV